MFDSINTNMIFGLHRLHDDKEIVGVTVMGDDYVMLGTPGLAQAASLKSDKKEAHVLFPFSYRLGGKPRTLHSYRKYNINRRTCGDYTKSHQIVVMPSFKDRSIDRVLSEVAKYGVVTAVMNNRSASAFVKGLWEIIKHYKYHSVFSFDQYYREQEDGEKVVPIVSFFDIRHCIPIFNSRKVDGFGIIYETVLPLASSRKGALTTTSILAVVLSQFRENLFYVDGKEIEEPVLLKREYTDALLKILDPKQRVEKKAKTKEPEEKIMWTDAKVSLGSSRYYSYTSSTTTNY